MCKAHLLIPEDQKNIFSDPTWSHPDNPLGLAFFEKNVTARGGFDALPDEAVKSMRKVAVQAEKL